MVMVLMDLSGDQTMSSSSPPQPQPQPPIGLAEQIANPDTSSSPSPSPFQTQTSTETDEHDDEHSKASNQTVVTMQRASQQQRPAQAQQKRAELRPGSSPSGGFGELNQQQRMIVSGGSSFGDEDDEGRLMMSVDSDEEISSRVVGANLRLDQAELEARLKQTRFGQQQGGKQAEVESSLVAQMRDIVEGKNQRNISPIPAKATVASQEEDKENIATMPTIANIEAGGQQPKSSNDSLSNNQNNDNGQSRVSMDNTGQKRSRHVSRHQCRHHHHQHNPHHQHHHHHHHHRHRQSISGGSLPGQIEAGASSETATSKPSSHTHHGPPHHRHNHGHHHHHHLGRQRHSNAGHHHHHHHHHAPGHNHHGHHHHHHHHHHHQNQQESEASKRGSPVQRLSLTLIEAGGDGAKAEATDGCTNDSSMSSVSSLANRQQRVGQTASTNATTTNPNQSKSSESAVSGEHNASVAAATNDGDQIAADKGASAADAGHSRNHHHHHHHHHHGNSNHQHHYHHQHCQHRSNKRRLVVDTRDDGEKQNDEPQEDTTRPVNDARREPLKDLANDQTIEIKGDQASQHQSQHHNHHHHHHHRNHCHCAHRHGVQTENQQMGDEDQSSTQSKGHLHHHHCAHRHHRYHHHHHHHHQLSRQQQQRSRQRSVSQTNVVTNDGDEQTEATNQTGEIAAERRSSVRAEIDEVVKMETSPPPQLGAPASGEAAQQASDEQANLKTLPDVASKPAAIVDGGEVDRDGASHGEALNEGSNFMDSKNQESLRSGSNEENDRQQQQQQQRQIDGANKLTRQMSSQSSRRSQNAGGALPPAESRDRRQSDHLRECAERALQPAAETTAVNQRENESTRQAVETTNGLLADRRCRLCWCCCCPCSALSTRDASSRPADKPKATGVQAASNSPVSSNYPSLPNVPLEEIRSWGESFDKLMRCSDGRKVFQDFLRCEYSEENILFWSACEELKKERDSKSVAAKARDIYEDYISILSSKEVSLDSRVRDVINNNIKRPTSNIFDEAQLQIYTLMHRDSYPRFINSIMYKKLAQIPISSSRKSSS